MDLTQEQFEELSAAILFADVQNYIDEHKHEYKLFVEAEEQSIEKVPTDHKQKNTND
jgi:hypothetical protein